MSETKLENLTEMNSLKYKILTSTGLLARSLQILEEMASLTEHPDDAALVAEVKKYLGVE